MTRTESRQFLEESRKSLESEKNECWFVFANYIVEEQRCQRALSRKELAGLVGVTAQMISSYERGVSAPSVHIAIRIAMALFPGTGPEAVLNLLWDPAPEYGGFVLEGNARPYRSLKGKK